ncbi:hypothetical protein J0H58_18935, partial [bacterium]|nr:hypothetical protein [bacterium]
MCWVAACLADALQYAHDRGLLHLDVKPSNVLLAGDGTPMLLDFHLARPPLRAGDPPPRSLGGTPAYMPPEQTAAVQAVQWQQPVTRAVDARADVFALGLVLDEALATVRVPPSLKALIARATAADPAARYPTAADLAADLRRHLADRPLRGVRDRSPRERWAKWRRRRPLALPAVVLCGALVALAGGVVARAADRAARADALLREGTGELAAGRPAEAAAVFEAGADALAGVPFHGALRDRLDAGRRAADRARAGAALRAACDHVRPVYGAEIVPAAEAAALHTACRELWAGRDRWENPTPAERDDLLDLAVLLADLEARVGAGDTGARRRALAVLDEADARFGPRAVLDRDRAVHLRALGQPEAAAAADRRAAAAPCRTAWDHLATGRAALATGDPAGAAAHLDRAVALDPGS